MEGGALRVPGTARAAPTSGAQQVRTLPPGRRPWGGSTGRRGSSGAPRHSPGTPGPHRRWAWLSVDVASRAPVRLDGAPRVALVDTGAEPNVIDEGQLPPGAADRLRPSGGRMRAANGALLRSEGTVDLRIDVGVRACTAQFAVVRGLCPPVILGRRTLWDSAQLRVLPVPTLPPIPPRQGDQVAAVPLLGVEEGNPAPLPQPAAVPAPPAPAQEPAHGTARGEGTSDWLVASLRAKLLRREHYTRAAAANATRRTAPQPRARLRDANPFQGLREEVLSEEPEILGHTVTDLRCPCPPPRGQPTPAAAPGAPAPAAAAPAPLEQRGPMELQGRAGLQPVSEAWLLAALQRQMQLGPPPPTPPRRPARFSCPPSPPITAGGGGHDGTADPTPRPGAPTAPASGATHAAPPEDGADRPAGASVTGGPPGAPAEEEAALAPLTRADLRSAEERRTRHQELTRAHGVAHCGAVAMGWRLKAAGKEWAGFTADCTAHVQACRPCQLVNKKRRRTQAWVVPVPEGPGRQLCLDILFLKRRPSDPVMAVGLLVDSFSGLVHTRGRLRTLCQRDILKWLREVLDSLPSVDTVRMDNDTRFRSPIEVELTRRGIRPHFTLPHAHQNSQADRACRMAREAFEKACAADPRLQPLEWLQRWETDVNQVPRMRTLWLDPATCARTTDATKLREIKERLEEAQLRRHQKKRVRGRLADGQAVALKPLEGSKAASDRMPAGPFIFRACRVGHDNCGQLYHPNRPFNQKWECAELRRLIPVGDELGRPAFDAGDHIDCGVTVPRWQSLQRGWQLGTACDGSDGDATASDEDGDDQVCSLLHWAWQEVTHADDGISDEGEDASDDDDHPRHVMALDGHGGVDRFVYGDDGALRFWASVSADSVDAHTIPKDREMVRLQLRTGAQPVFRQPYPCPVHLREAERGVLNDLLRLHKIEEDEEGEWNAPWFLKAKPDGSWRPLVDFSATSKAFEGARCPLPLIDDAVRQLAGFKWKTVIDIKDGFHQKLVHPACRRYTAFTAAGRRWRWRVLPFGLAQSPGAFHNWLRKALQPFIDLGWCVLYVDDIAIGGDTAEECAARSALVRELLEQLGIKINPRKVQHVQQVVKLLGFAVGYLTVDPLTSYTAAVAAIPLPQTCKQLESLRGAVVWIARFIPQCSLLLSAFVAAWQEWRKLGPRADPTDAVLRNLDAIRDAVRRHITLSPVDTSQGELWLHTDASDEGMGASLSQVIGSERRLLGVWSKPFNAAQQHYRVREREFLAVVGALRHFHHMVYPRRLHVVTDHKANVTGIGIHRKVNVQKLLGWLEEVQGYDLDWRHIRGADNALADLLSRLGGRAATEGEMLELMGA